VSLWLWRTGLCGHARAQAPSSQSSCCCLARLCERLFRSISSKPRKVCMRLTSRHEPSSRNEHSVFIALLPNLESTETGGVGEDLIGMQPMGFAGQVYIVEEYVCGWFVGPDWTRLSQVWEARSLGDTAYGIASRYPLPYTCFHLFTIHPFPPVPETYLVKKQIRVHDPVRWLFKMGTLGKSSGKIHTSTYFPRGPA